MPVVRLSGSRATAAWSAYRSNKSFFGAQQRGYAETLPHPAVIFLHLPESQMASRHGVTDEELAAKHMGREAGAALLLSAPSASNVVTLLYVHVRTNQLGSGLASRLLSRRAP